MNWINPVNLMGQIVYLCQLYSEDKQKTHSVSDFVYKIKSTIVNISEIQFVDSSWYYIKVSNLDILYAWASD